MATAQEILITNARVINEGKTFDADVRIRGDRIDRVDGSIGAGERTRVIDAAGMILMPGMIDDQVHFREPGLTHKGDLATESRAAIAGGITSFMDMPNVKPLTVTREALADKYRLAEGRCAGNYGFYLGGTNTNIDEIRALEIDDACGIKVFMGASTGNMLVDDHDALDMIFRDAPVLVVTHCEDTPTIQANERHAREQYGDDVPMSEHPNIRSADACFRSSTLATELARSHDALLHVLHLTTALEMPLFAAGPMSEKRITGEVCVHHLWFDDTHYPDQGTRIKCNPAIKTPSDREALIDALKADRLDVIATDHAPHTADEKANSYFSAPAGLPLVQHAVLLLFDLAAEGTLSHELIVQKACHAPADLFGVVERGYIREGWFADLVLVDPDRPQQVTADGLLSKCGWSPFEGHRFTATIDTTIVNGQVAYSDGRVAGEPAGRRLRFNRRR